MTDRLPYEEGAVPRGAADLDADLDAKLVAALERLGQALRVQMWDAAKDGGLSPTQLQVLLRLAADPPARRRIGALAVELDVTHPTVSDAVAALERKELVRREPGGRRATLVLTPVGRRLAGTLAGWDERTRHALAEVADADKRAGLRMAMDMIAALQRAGAISIARMCSTCRFFRRDAHAGSNRPHHCALLDVPMAAEELRVDCAEHQVPATASGR